MNNTLFSGKILVSSCLAGIPCRYDGKSNGRSEIINLVASGRAVCVCPEVLGGLLTPRIPCERIDNEIIDSHGNNRTKNFLQGAYNALCVAKHNNCCVAILKARSPSCGCGSIYDGTFTKTLISGNGIFAELLLQNGFAVFTEENFQDSFLWAELQK